MFIVIFKNYWQLVLYAESWKCAEFCGNINNYQYHITEICIYWFLRECLLHVETYLCSVVAYYSLRATRLYLT
jgi:hypothetical protein